MEAVLEEALKGFVSDTLSSDKPCSELSLKIFFIFKNIASSHDQIKGQQIAELVKSYLLSLTKVKEQSSATANCVGILRGQILMRLFFIWVARDCIKQDVDANAEIKPVSDEIIKLCEMFCIRTDPMQLNVFLSETATRMFVEYVPDILESIFDEFLLPLPKELTSGVADSNFSPLGGSSFDNEPKEESFDDSSAKPRKSARRLIMSPIKAEDSASRQNLSRFGKRPSRQILVASRGDSNSAKVKPRNKRLSMVTTSSTMNTSSADRRVSMRSQSFDHFGSSSKQPPNAQVKRCLFGGEMSKPPPAASRKKSVAANPPGYTTPRKRTASSLLSVADTPPMDNQKVSRIAPMTPLSKITDQENQGAPMSPGFPKPNGIPFRVITTPLRQLQQQHSPMAPGTVLVPQSPDDAKAGITARSFYTRPAGTPQSIVQATKRNLLTGGNSSRRTMSSYDFGVSAQSGHNESTHFLFAELMMMSPTKGITESSVYISTKTCDVMMSPVNRGHLQNSVFSSPVVDSKSRKGRSVEESPFSVAAGYVCE